MQYTRSTVQYTLHLTLQQLKFTLYPDFSWWLLAEPQLMHKGYLYTNISQCL